MRILTILLLLCFCLDSFSQSDDSLPCSFVYEAFSDSPNYQGGNDELRKNIINVEVPSFCKDLKGISIDFVVAYDGKIVENRVHGASALCKQKLEIGLENIPDFEDCGENKNPLECMIYSIYFE